MASKFSVELFKVPFDNTYKKVFDINSRKPGDTPKTAFYNEVLRKTTQYFTVESNIINLKRYNNRIIFTISHSYFAIRQYNYICLNYLNNKYFYFITDIVSENDNAVNPSVTITGEWDIWHNNLNTIYSDADYSDLVNMNKIIYGHRTTYKNYNGDLRQIPYRNTEERMFVKKNEVFTYKNVNTTTDVEIGNALKILWLKLTVTDEFFTVYNDKLKSQQSITVSNLQTGEIFDKDSVIKGVRPITNSNFTNIIYIPYGVFYKGESVEAKIINTLPNGTDAITAKYKPAVDINVFATVKFNAEQYIIGKIPVSSDIYDNIYRITNETGMTDYITAIELTYYSPYKYTYTVREAPFDATIHVLTPIVKLTDFFIGNESRDILTFGYIDSFTVKQNLATNTYKFYSTITDIDDLNSYYFEFVKNYKIDLRESFMGRGVSKEVYRYSDSGGVIEPQKYLFPFSYYTIFFNGDEYILQVPIKEYTSNYNGYSDLKCEYRIEIHTETSQPFFKLYFNDNLLFNGNKFLNNSGLVSYSKDASSSYAIRNGAQDISSMALKTIASGIKGGYVGGLMSGIDNSVGLISKYYDLSKTPDSPQSSSRSEDDIYIQDDIKIYKNTVVDSIIENEKLKSCYIYGYDFISYDDLFKNHKFWWDYRKTINCNINIPLKNDEKEIIERMFNNGVHLFHINYGNNKYYVDYDMEINEKIYWNIDKDIAIYNERS